MAARRKKNPHPLLTQAHQIAAASQPTIGSINRQYGRSLDDARGFTQALIAELRGGQGAVDSAYQPAQDEMSRVNAAAQASLAALGGPYGQGAAIAAQSSGDSQLGQLLGDRASASAYAGKLPGIGAARGQLAGTALINARQDALSNRADSIAAQTPAILRQLQDQAFARRMALANLHLSQSQLASENAHWDAQMQYQQGRDAVSDQHWQVEQQTNNAHFRQQMIGQYGYDPKTGKFTQGQATSMASSMGLTPNEFLSLQSHTVTQMENMIGSGASFDQTVRRAVSVGVPYKMARALAIQTFSNVPPPPKPDKRDYQTRDKDGTVKTDDTAYRQAVAAYNRRMMTLRWFHERLQSMLSNAGRPAGPGRPLPHPH